MAHRASGVPVARRSFVPAIAAIPAWLAAVANATAAPVGSPAIANELELVVVTAPRMTAPLLVVTDPKQPRQPLPAHDGADYLKAIPGFSVIRKGGTDGDPVFRGMAASRVNMLIDGRTGARRLRHAHGSADGLCLPGGLRSRRGRSRDRRPCCMARATPPRACRSSATSSASQRAPLRTAACWAAASAAPTWWATCDSGTPDVYGQLTGTRAESDDYTDGNGNEVHSRYQRWSTQRGARLDA